MMSAVGRAAPGSETVVACSRRPLVALAALGLGFALLVSSACRPDAPTVDPEYRAEVEAWRAQRLERLAAEDGWLTLVGLHWLEPGANVVGSAADADVPLPRDLAPAVVATLELRDDGTVSLEPDPDADLEVGGGPARPGVLATDAAGRPDLLSLGRLGFFLIQRGDRVGVRVKDPQAPTRLHFQGLEHYAVDPSYRVQARLEPYDTLQEVAVPTVLGTAETMLAPGILHFTLHDADVSLVPLVSGPDDDAYFLVFRDATSGDTTYGAGRFLSAPTAGEDGLTVLDFNLSYNPPCAFTPYATCPLPPRGNTLPVPIRAGERYSGPPH